MELLNNLSALATTASVLAFLLSLILMPFKSQRGFASRMGLLALAIGIPAGFLLNYTTEQKAMAAGFEKASDMRLAKEAGITDPKAFYADAQGIRERVKQKRLAEETARKKAAQAEQDAVEAAERAQRQKEARAAAEAITELATAAPLDQQPSASTEFGRGYYRYASYLRTPAGYPFIRMREDVPVCTNPYAVKEATDALKAKDYTWLTTVRACKLFQKGTAVEWTKESFGGLAVVEVRLKTPEGGRITAYAPDNSDAGIQFWMGFYDVTEMRAKAAGKGK